MLYPRSAILQQWLVTRTTKSLELHLGALRLIREDALAIGRERPLLPSWLQRPLGMDLLQLRSAFRDQATDRARLADWPAVVDPGIQWPIGEVLALTRTLAYCERTGLLPHPPHPMRCISCGTLPVDIGNHCPPCTDRSLITTTMLRACVRLNGQPAIGG